MKLAQLLLVKAGHTVSCAEDAETGVALARHLRHPLEARRTVGELLTLLEWEQTGG